MPESTQPWPGNRTPHAGMPAPAPAESPAAGRHPSAPARGILLALLLSTPVWLGLGIAVWQATAPGPGEAERAGTAIRGAAPAGR